MTFINIPRPITIYAAHQLASVDYNIATKISEDVSTVIEWGYNHNLPWVSSYAMETLQSLDHFGSFIIALVAWLVYHTK